VVEVNTHLAALRADRDRWRERAEELSKSVHEWGKQALEQETRIAELEAAQATQMTTIETLTARHDKDEALVASLEADLAAAKAQPARKYPTVEQVERWNQESNNDPRTHHSFYRWLLDRAREQEGKGTITSKETAP
jgi:uncharacterized coiled-coil protein SlyX